MTKARIARHYTWKRDVPPRTGWSIKAGQGVSKAGRQDTAVEFGTVPPKAGRLTLVLCSLNHSPPTLYLISYDTLHSALAHARPTMRYISLVIIIMLASLL